MQKYEHGGNIYDLAASMGIPASRILDFSANINPKGPPAWIKDCILDSMDRIVHYPDPEAKGLRRLAANEYQVREQEVIAGNGSTELLYSLPGLYNFSQAIIPVPSYVDYEKVAKLHKLAVTHIHLREEDDFELSLIQLEKQIDSRSLIFLGQPNNPTGKTINPVGLRKLANAYPDSLFVIDEAFADFIPELDRLYTNRPANVLVLLSLTKFFAIPGIRLGLGIGDPSVLERMSRSSPPWSVNSLAQEIGIRALADQKYIQDSRSFTQNRKRELYAGLKQIPCLQVFDSDVNFFLCKLHNTDLDAPTLNKHLLRDHLAIRDCSNYAGLNPDFFRVAVRNADDNAALLQALSRNMDNSLSCFMPREFAKESNSREKQKEDSKLPPAIMLQGTSSNAGKSILAAAICRILFQDGYSVAPFKAQNMSLNSFVTRNGGEMGRAQVLQAQACRLEPDVLMNPILLKPSSDTGSQVILLGEPVENMDVNAYIHYKEQIISKVREAYLELAESKDVIILEGAGSPAEINLKQHDITNMTMARIAGANVLLTGDIDRGGVFASFIGTMELFEDWETDLTSGFIINRFRGQKSLLDPAIDETEQRTGKPVLGVVPYIGDLGLPEEDSVTFKSGWDKIGSSPDSAAVNIACLDLPHISNFTDLEPLLQEPDVHVNILKTGSKPETPPDVLIIPGSKNVLGDLEALDNSKTSEDIKRLAADGQTLVVGICGGFQMLGEQVADPHGIESEQKTRDGLGLLPIFTELAPQKSLCQVQATHLTSNTTLQGYEIHHGKTKRLQEEVKPLITSPENREIGLSTPDEGIWGTYLHGLFDADEFRRWFIDQVRKRKGLEPLEEIQTRYDLEENLDRLADIVRENLDMQKIYSMLER